MRPTKLVLIPSLWGNTPNYFQSWNQRSWSPRLGMHLRSPAYMKIISSKERPFSLFKNNGMTFPSEKSARWKEANLLWIHEGRLGCLSVHRWRENLMALAMVPFSMVTLTALVVHSFSKGYNWNLTQELSQILHLLVGTGTDSVISIQSNHQSISVENTQWASRGSFDVSPTQLDLAM